MNMIRMAKEIFKVAKIGYHLLQWKMSSGLSEISHEIMRPIDFQGETAKRYLGEFDYVSNSGLDPLGETSNHIPIMCCSVEERNTTERKAILVASIFYGVLFNNSILKPVKLKGFELTLTANQASTLHKCAAGTLYGALSNRDAMMVNMVDTLATITKSEQERIASWCHDKDEVIESFNEDQEKTALLVTMTATLYRFYAIDFPVESE